MPGIPLPRESRKLDTVIVAARYRAADGELSLARAYERRGNVWTDLVLLSRAAILERLRAGKRVVAGEPQTLPGAFRVVGRVRLVASDGAERLAVQERSIGRDDLGLPHF